MMDKTYLKKIAIKNIKVITSIVVEIPVIVDSSDIRHGVLLTGTNRKGKTTVLQCLNHGLCNNIGENLDVHDCIRKGETKGGFDIDLYDLNNNEYKISFRFEKDEHGKVSEKFVCKTPSGNIKNKTAIRKLFNYHYINANEIIKLASDTKGRRRLMEYFLYSVPDTVRHEYLELDTKEQKANKEPTPLNIKKNELKTITEESKLTIEEEQVLKKEAEVNVIVAKLKANIKANNEKIDEYHNLCEKNNKLASDIANYELEISNLEGLHKACVNETSNNNLKETIENIRYTIETCGKRLLEIADVTGTPNIHEAIEASNDLVSNLSRFNPEAEAVRLNNLIGIRTQYEADITSKTHELEALEIEHEKLCAKINLQPELVKECNTLNEQYSDKLKDVEIIIDEINLLRNKHEVWQRNRSAYEKAYREWREKDNDVKMCRNAKKQIILEQDIKVENFEFTPDGVELKGFNLSESNISGADRRIVAMQFTIAMNKNVGFVVLEEMESLDDDEERKVFRFAADNGLVLIGDNVVKTAETLEPKIINIS